MDLQEQVKAYTAWVNSQLKKKSLQIKDLSKDLNDGVLLIAVVEIVSGQQLKTVQPKNDEDKKENVLKVINFMKHSGIKLHHVTTEEIIAGNVKTLMQLILALAAHFKPASIGGRRSTTSSPHTSTPNIHRLKTSSRESSPPAKKQIDFLKGSQDDFQQEIKEIESLALKLQQLLLLETDGEAIDSTEEQLVIMQAKMNQNNVAKQQYEDELVQLQETCKDLTTSNTALECRLKQQENELMLLKQELMRSNLARDKLKSDKAELSVDVEDFREEMEKYRSKFHEKELHYVQLEDDFMKAKADHVRALARKDKQIREMEKQQQLMSPTVDNVFRESSFRLSSPNSPKLGRKSPSMLSRNSPTLARKSPVSRHNPPRRRKISDNSQTRILYFTDRDMTPAMTTIAKRVGDITLGEFKAAVKKQGNFRFIFKALDPELGTVKEEVFRDDDVIPGWEGKIVAWVEEVLHV